MTTVDEARAALRDQWYDGISSERRRSEFEDNIVALIAAVRAECVSEAEEVKRRQDAIAQVRAESAETLRALREAATATLAASDAHDGSLFDALLALRAALAATEAEEEHSRIVRTYNEARR